MMVVAIVITWPSEINHFSWRTATGKDGRFVTGKGVSMAVDGPSWDLSGQPATVVLPCLESLKSNFQIILPATFHPVEVEILGNTNKLLKPRQPFQPSPHFHCRNLPAGRAAKGRRLPSSWQKYAKMLLNIVQSLGMPIDSALPEDWISRNHPDPTATSHLVDGVRQRQLLSSWTWTRIRKGSGSLANIQKQWKTSALKVLGWCFTILHQIGRCVAAILMLTIFRL